MKTDDFEKRLQRLPQQKVPADWRERILTQAQLANAPEPKTALYTQNWLHSFLQFIQRPRGLAWSGVGSAWILILTLNLASQDTTTFTTTPSIPSASTLQALQRQQKLLLAELGGVLPPANTIEPKPNTVGPRSARNEEVFAV